MIGLNKIGLNQVQLNQLYLNTLCACQKSSGGDGFPRLPGDVTRWSFKGLTNEQMSKNPSLEDADHKGRFLTFKNFLWGRMSGVGGYNQNFNQWGYGNLSTATQTHTSYKIELSVPSTLKTANIYSNVNVIEKEGDVYDFTLNIVGLKDGALLRITKGVVSGVIERIEKDGIYKIYQPIEAGWDQPRIYIFISNPNSIDLNITIEQLPIYPGALVFDGVDDYGVCKNFPILTKEKGYTVVALRRYLSNKVDKVYSLVTNAPSAIVSRSTITFELIGNDKTKTNFSFGRGNPVIDFEPNVFSYMTSKSYNGKIITPGDYTEHQKRLLVGNFSESGRYGCNVAIWELVFLDHDATEEELTKIKDYFVKTYPWLFPDQAWTVVGKSNEDTDRATIANITGNGNDLVLSNFGFAGGSGYGLYAVNFLDSIWVKNTGLTKISPSSFTIENTIEPTQATVYINTSGKDVILPSFKVNITGLGNVVWKYHYIDDAGDRQSIILQDGVNVLPTSYVSLSATSTWVGFGTITGVTDNITIEQIPEYEGYLVTDGVDDKIVSSVFGMGKDFTIVGEWEFIKETVNKNSGIWKPNSFALNDFTFSNQIMAYIKSIISTSVYSKGVKALASDGKLYKDFNSEQELVVGNEEDKGTELYIGYFVNTFNKIAFKNLAIYPRILSKDECIKAYNYLQTLKAK